MTYATLMLALFLQGGGSLFSDTAPNLFLFRDFKARSLNDILTIQINESSTASNSANTSTNKEGDVSVKAPGLGGLEKGASMLNFANILSGASSLNFAGQGSTSRTGQLQAFVSAKVVQVFPNGDLGIEGIKEVTINRERQVLRIRGIVRPRDVTPTNVVLSTAIANMEVVFDGKGIVSDANKPGFLFRLIQWITPF
jgi:flagellar L-ring protein precursor FlgH